MSKSEFVGRIHAGIIDAIKRIVPKLEHYEIRSHRSLTEEHEWVCAVIDLGVFKANVCFHKHEELTEELFNARVRGAMISLSLVIHRIFDPVLDCGLNTSDITAATIEQYHKEPSELGSDE